MKVSCLQENLVKGLNLVSRAVAPRTAALPVLTHVLLSTDNGRLKIAATNLELGITCWIGAKVESDGAIALPARTFSGLVGLLPQDKVELELNPRTQTLRILTDHTDATIKGMDAQDFPIIPTFNPNAATVASIDPAVLKRMISQVVFAAATDESRPMLTGVHIRLDGTSISMAATDSFRLSLRKAELNEPVAVAQSFLVPAKAMAEVARVMGEQEEPVAISVTPSNGQVLFHMAHVDVVAQLLDQKFPEVEDIIPKKHATRTVVNSADFLKACRQASIFASENLDIMKLSIQPGEELEPGKLTVMGQADETGENLSQLQASVNGAAIDIAFNVKYLIDVLSAVDAPQIAIETNAPRGAGVVKMVGDDDFLHIIMSMNR